MSNKAETIETLIICLRDGKDPDLALQYAHNLTEAEINECFEIAETVIDLYDGKFPIDPLNVGDICIDAFHCSPCIITNINDHSIHVLYFNGKTHKFKKYQEGQFKKLGTNFRDKLHLFMDDCSLMCKCDRELKKGPGYDYSEQKRMEDAE